MLPVDQIGGPQVPQMDPRLIPALHFPFLAVKAIDKFSKLSNPSHYLYLYMGYKPRSLKENYSLEYTVRAQNLDVIVCLYFALLFWRECSQASWNMILGPEFTFNIILLTYHHHHPAFQLRSS